MADLFLHVGLHKTGTTAIQKFAAKNRKKLRKKGLLYPDYKPLTTEIKPDHHGFASAVAGIENTLSYDQLGRLVDEWKERAEEEACSVLLSSERMCRLFHEGDEGSWTEKRKRYLQHLADLLAGFEVKVVIVIRRQDEFIKSYFKEKIYRNSTKERQDFTEFKKFFDKEWVSNMYLGNIRLFEEIFPQVEVLTYEDLQREQGLIKNFFSIIGTDVDELEEVGVVRRSLSPGELALKSYLNRSLITPQENNELATEQSLKIISWMRNERVQEIIRKYYGNNGQDIWESHEERTGFLEQFNQMNEEIRKQYFPDKEQLFPPVRARSSVKISPVSDQMKTDLILSACDLQPGKYTKKIIKLLKPFKRYL